jgi:hypothetical protein
LALAAAEAAVLVIAWAWVAGRKQAGLDLRQG